MSYYRPYHKTIQLTRCFNDENIAIDIDEEIADLIQLMWKLNIDTSSCCQNDPPHDKIYIQFRNAESCKKFINIITDYADPNDDQEMELYRAVDEEKDIIIRTMIRDDNMPIADHPEDHDKATLQQFQRPYPNFNFHANIFIDQKYKTLIMKKLEEYSSSDKNEKKQRLDCQWSY